MKRKHRTKSFVRNKADLAKALGVAYKTIIRWSTEPGFPVPRTDGRWNIAEVRAWTVEQGKENEVEPTGTNAESLIDKKARKLDVEIKTGVTKLAILKGQYVDIQDVQKLWGDAIMQAKKILLSGPSSLAPQVVGVSVVEAEKLLRDWLHEALSKLSADPVGNQKAT